MKKSAFVLLLMVVCLMIAPFSQAEETAYEPLPALLSFSQHTETTRLSETLYDRRTYPDSPNAAVNEEISALVDTLAVRANAYAPAKGSKKNAAYVDTGATVTVTGTKIASFLTLSHILFGNEQVYVDFDTRVYDMETGARLELADILQEGAYALLSKAVRERLTEYFPAETPDAPALDALCAPDALAKNPFTLTPVSLTLHYRADALYPHKTTLMHVRIPYTALSEWLTPLGLSQTDNSRYRTAALTFDDGPARGVTQQMLLTLREDCAPGTFFNLGQLLLGSKDAVAWEHDANHAVQSHTYRHDYKAVTQAQILKLRDRFASEQEQIIGVAPEYMRAPGGNDKRYTEQGVDLPIIRWNCLSGDASSDVSVSECMSTFVYTLKDHSVVLMHNIRRSSIDVAKAAIERLRARGYLLVTVDELFALRGVTLENNVVYFGDETALNVAK